MQRGGVQDQLAADSGAHQPSRVAARCRPCRTPASPIAPGEAEGSAPGLVDTCQLNWGQTRTHHEQGRRSGSVKKSRDRSADPNWRASPGKLSDHHCALTAHHQLPQRREYLDAPASIRIGVCLAFARRAPLVSLDDVILEVLQEQSQPSSLQVDLAAGASLIGLGD